MIRMTPDDLRELLRAEREPAASPLLCADTQRLRAALCEAPEYDDADMVGAAVATIARLSGCIDEMRREIGRALNLIPEAALDVMTARIQEMREECDAAKALADRRLAMAVRMDEGARENMAEALGRPDLHSWGELQQAARGLIAHANGEKVPDAVPLLCARDADADSCIIEWQPPTIWPIATGDVLFIGGWSYMVRWNNWRGQVRHTSITPLDGAPVIPTGEGLTIAMARPNASEARDADIPDDWAVPEAPLIPLAPLIHSITGECEEGDPSHPIHAAVAVIERLKDDRARSEQRRIDIAEKMGLMITALHAMHIAQNDGDLDSFDARAEIAAQKQAENSGT